MFSTFLSFIFPQTPHDALVQQTRVLQPDPHTITTASGTSILSCTKYAIPQVKAAIRELKNRKSIPAAVLLANLLADTLLEELADIHLWNSAQVVIVPLPNSRKKTRLRGFNPTEELCKALPEEMSALVDTHILVQIKDVPAQKTLSRTERLCNKKGIFYVTKDIQNQHVILVDDVVTTGASLTEATLSLEKAGAVVTAVACARS
tara:strand:- start:1246 stop:1860 length:615 start_codon:yes stop_codon:yes gene_type:complete